MRSEERAAPRRICAAEGCARPVERDERYCETCTIEWALYRRDRRERAAHTSARLVG